LNWSVHLEQKQICHLH